MMIQPDTDGTEPYGRVFIDVTQPGCSCGCKYCYVPNVPAEVLLETCDLNRIATDLVQLRERKLPDERTQLDENTLLTFGSHSDLCKDDRLFKVFLRVLGSVVDLGCPIQIATKHFVDQKKAYQLACVQAWAGQITVFVSCPVGEKNWRTLEPRTSDPQKRLEGMMYLKEYNISTCLLIKPYLPNYSERQIATYLNWVRTYEPDVLCVGSLYWDDRIKDGIREVCSGLAHIREATGLQHPLAAAELTRRPLDHVVKPEQQFVRDLQRRVDPQIPVVQSAPCAVARLLRRPCATKVWKYYPELCRGGECQNCKVLDEKWRHRPESLPLVVHAS